MCGAEQESQMKQLKHISSVGLLVAIIAQSQAQVNTTLSQGVRFHRQGVYKLELWENGRSTPSRVNYSNIPGPQSAQYRWSHIVTGKWYQARIWNVQVNQRTVGPWFYVPSSSSFTAPFIHVW